MRISFAHVDRRENRRSLAMSDRKEIAHLEALEIAILRGSGKSRRRNRRESRDHFGALKSCELASPLQASNLQSFSK